MEMRERKDTILFTHESGMKVNIDGARERNEMRMAIYSYFCDILLLVFGRLNLCHGNLKISWCRAYHGHDIQIIVFYELPIVITLHRLP